MEGQEAYEWWLTHQTETEYHTFDEWRHLGYFVCKSEKAVARNSTGIAIFGKSQVAEIDYYEENIDVGD